MARKRVEAWAVVDLWGCRALCFSAEEAKPPHSAIRRVRLVECGPDEVVVPKAAAAVVRAAVNLVKHLNDYDENIEPAVLARIVRAVERMKKGRK